MSKPKNKAGVKAESRIVPAGSKLTAGSDVLSVEHEGSKFTELKWDDVQTIFGYTRICDGTARLTLQFCLPKDKNGIEHSLAVDDSVQGWERFQEDLRKVFPAMKREWAKIADFEEAAELADLAPTYVANPVEVWARQISQ